MPKIKISLEPVSISAGANPYVSEDGLANFATIAKLQDRIAATIKAAAKTEEPVKVTGVYVMKRRAKPVQFRAAQHAKADVKYRSQRAIKVALRKRVAPEALARVAIVLQVADIPKLAPSIKQAVAALNSHMKKSEGVLAKVSKDKAKIRDTKNAYFDASAEHMMKVMEEAGYTEADMILSTGMMGKTLLLRLDADHYVSVTGSDKARFTAAVKASKEQG